MPPIRWKDLNTPQIPYQRRKPTKASAIHTEAEWEIHKVMILWWRKNHEVSEIVEKLAEIGFEASGAQVKHHLTKWGNRKYLKLTDGQMEYIAEEVITRQVKGEKAAVRLNGTKVPSKKMGATLKKRSDILREVESTIMNEEGSILEPEYESYDTSNPDLEELESNPHESFFTKALARAPSIINSLRITVYTSSTAQGIRQLVATRSKSLLGFGDDRTRKLTPKGNLLGRPFDPPQLSPPVLDIDSCNFWDLAERDSLLLVAEAVTDPLRAHQLKWEVLALRILYPGIVRTRQLAETDHQPDRSSLDISFLQNFSSDLYGHIYKEGGEISRLDFDPEFVVDRESNAKTFVISSEKLQKLRLIHSPSSFKDLRAKFVGEHLKAIEENFAKFLACQSADQQLVRRVIDTDSWPEDVWAVDVTNLTFEIDLAFEPRDYGLDVGLRYAAKAQALGLAWCTRQAKGWDHWIRFLKETCTNGDIEEKFACGHGAGELAADGPVIFTITLERRCWEKGGCESLRLYMHPDFNPILRSRGR